MNPILPAYRTVNICYATNDAYAKYMMISLYSLMCNSSATRYYDVIVLSHDISNVYYEQAAKLMEHFPNFKVRFVDMTFFHHYVENKMSYYITPETNYRLAILGDLFRNYDKMLYLDCDVIVEDDVAKLFDTDLGDYALGGCIMIESIYLALSKKALFYKNAPINITNYFKNIVEIEHHENYINAGVALFNLNKCRSLVTLDDALNFLNSRELIYNDQDVLNKLFNNSMKLLDIRWNYTINIPQYANSIKPKIREKYEPLLRDKPGIIHFVSINKPWKGPCPLHEHFHHYEDLFNEFMITHD